MDYCEYKPQSAELFRQQGSPALPLAARCIVRDAYYAALRERENERDLQSAMRTYCEAARCPPNDAFIVKTKAIEDLVSMIREDKNLIWEEEYRLAGEMQYHWQTIVWPSLYNWAIKYLDDEIRKVYFQKEEIIAQRPRVGGMPWGKILQCDKKSKNLPINSIFTKGDIVQLAKSFAVFGKCREKLLSEVRSRELIQGWMPPNEDGISKGILGREAVLESLTQVESCEFEGQLIAKPPNRFSENEAIAKLGRLSQVDSSIQWSNSSQRSEGESLAECYTKYRETLTSISEGLKKYLAKRKPDIPRENLENDCKVVAKQGAIFWIWMDNFQLMIQDANDTLNQEAKSKPPADHKPYGPMGRSAHQNKNPYDCKEKLAIIGFLLPICPSVPRLVTLTESFQIFSPNPPEFPHPKSRKCTGLDELVKGVSANVKQMHHFPWREEGV